MAITRLRPIADVVLRDAGHRYEYEKLEDERVGGGKAHSYADGFGQSRHMADLVRNEECLLRTHWLEATVDSGSMIDCTDFVVPAADGAYLCRPYIDKWQAVRKRDFYYAPYADRADFEEANANVGLATDYLGNSVSQYVIHQLNSTPNQPARTAKSWFRLPPNPFFCVAMTRQEPHADHEGDAYTAIIFGAAAGEAYALYMPFGGSPKMAQYKAEKTVQYMEDERGVMARDVWEGVWSSGENDGINIDLPSSEGWPKGERVFIWIGVIGGQIAVSTDGFQNDVALWRPEKDDSLTHFDHDGVIIPSIRVHEGQVGVEGRGCEFSFTFYMARMFDTMFRSLPIPALYKTEDSAGDFTDSRVIQPWWPTTEDWEVIGEQLDDTPLVAFETRSPPLSGTWVVNDEYPEGYYPPLVGRGWFGQWDLTLKPRVDYCKQRDSAADYALANGEPLFAYRSAQVTGITFAQKGVVTDAELGVDVSVDEDDAPTFIGDYSAGGEAGRFTLYLDPDFGALKALGSRRYFELTPGWAILDDSGSVDQETTDTQALFGGYALQPILGIAGGEGEYMEVPLVDDLLRFGEMKVDGRVPSFDDFLVKDAFEWILARCGIPESKQDIEDTGRRLPFRANEWLNLPGKGVYWGDILSELCSYDHNAALWIEPDGTVTKGCRHCRSARTSTKAADTYWAKHRHINDTGCLATDVIRNSSGVYREFYTRGGKATDPATGYGEVVHLERYSEQLPGLEFATHVEVAGKDARGRPVTVIANCEAAVRNENDARFTGGWPIFDTYHADNTILSIADAADRAKMRAFAVCHVNEFVSVRQPLDPYLRKGYTFQIAGGEDLGLDEVKFRTVALTYDLDKTTGEAGMSVIGRRMEHANAPVIPI